MNKPRVIVQDAVTAYELVRLGAYDPETSDYEFSFLPTATLAKEHTKKLVEFCAASKPFMELKAKLWAAGGSITFNPATGEVYSELLEDYVEADKRLDACIDLLQFQIFGGQND